MLDWLKVPWDDIEKELESKVESVFLKGFETITDTEQELEEVRKRFPNLNEVALGNEIIKDSSKVTAVIGGGAALPDLIPGLGWVTMTTTLVGDFCLTLREEMSMLLKFSFLFDPDCEIEQRKRDVVSLLMILARDKDKNAFAKEVLEDMDKVQIDVLSRKILIRVGVQLGLKFFRKKLMAFIPGIGIALSGGVNYLGTRQVGKLGIDFFRNKAEFIRVHGQSSTNLEVTKRASLQMMINLAKMGEKVSENQKTMVLDAMDIFGYTESEKEALLADLGGSDITPITVKDIRKMTDDDRKYVLKQGLQILGQSATTKQENYLEFITRAFGLTQTDLKKIKQQLKEDSQGD